MVSGKASQKENSQRNEQRKSRRVLQEKKFSGNLQDINLFDIVNQGKIAQQQ